MIPPLGQRTNATKGGELRGRIEASESWAGRAFHPPLRRQTQSPVRCAARELLDRQRTTYGTIRKLVGAAGGVVSLLELIGPMYLVATTKSSTQISVGSPASS